MTNLHRFLARMILVVCAFAIAAVPSRAEAQKPAKVAPKPPKEKEKEAEPEADKEKEKEHEKAPAKEKEKEKDAEEEDVVKKPTDRKGEIKEIGLMITNVNRIDVLKEVWEFEGVLTISSNRPHVRKCAAGPIGELFPDGVVKKVDEIDEYEENGKTTRQCKVTVEHTSEISVARYPFDKHELEVVIGDEGDAAAGVEFKPLTDKESTGVGDRTKLGGWEFGEIVGTQETFEHAHGKQKLTRVNFKLHTHRPVFTAFVKGFAAVLFQLLIALVGLVLSAKAAPNRISIATGALIATATAHNLISNQIGVTYLTTADKFFFLSYFLLLLNVVISATMLRAEEAKNEDRVKLLFRLAWVILPVVTVIGATLVLSGVI